MNEVAGQRAEVHMTVSITRKATGLTETYELVGQVGQVPQHPFQPQPEPDPEGDKK